MGTNYYIAGTRQHIGKRCSLGFRGMEWIWAVEPSYLEGFDLFSTETGKLLNRQQLTADVLECSSQTYDSIGIEFS